MIKLLAKHRKPKVDWNLDWEFLKWLNKWFKVYKQEAKIDLTFHTFKYQDKELTKEQIIDRIIYLTDALIDESSFFNADEEEAMMVDEIFDLFHLVFWSMWW